MLIGFETSPESSGHSFRGIGAYTQNLKKALSRIKTDLKIEFFDNSQNGRKYDLVHYPYFDLFFHTLPIRKTFRNRIVTIHDVIPLLFPDKFPSGIKGYINLLLQKMALKNVDYVICDSKTSKADIADKLAVPLDKIKVIYLAAGEEFKQLKNKSVLKKIARKYDLPAKFSLYVGDVNWNKNIDNLLIATKESKIPIVMVGKAATDLLIPQVRQINGQIKKLKIEKHVIKTGFVKTSDLVSIYNLASVTVLPSYYEGFGLPVLESMACGTPVVCSNNSSLSEIAGDVATFCDPSDPKDIAKQISYIVNLKNDSKESVSKRGIEQAAKFSWRKTAQQTIDVYKKVLFKK